MGDYGIEKNHLNFRNYLPCSGFRPLIQRKVKSTIPIIWYVAPTVIFANFLVFDYDSFQELHNLLHDYRNLMKPFIFETDRLPQIGIAN